MIKRKHLIIPDCQVKPGINLDYLEWIGKFAADKHPDVIINLGDFADMESLSSYDKGKKSFEGRRYKLDIESAKQGMQLLMRPILAEQDRLSRQKKKKWNPEMHMVLGNHENRINRVIENDSILDGTISIDDLEYSKYWTVHDFLKPVNVDGVMYCLTPDHKILTKSLEYIPLGDVKVGTEIIAFDENLVGKYRYYRNAVIEKLGRAIAPLYIVELSNGKTFKVTEDHKWFVRTSLGYDWVSTKNLKIHFHKVPQLFDEFNFIDSYESGWLSGLFDGEGYIYSRNTQGGFHLAFAQNDGVVLNNACNILKKMNIMFECRKNNNDNCNVIHIRGSSNDKLKLLGQIRPKRLIEKFNPINLGRVQKRDNVDLQNIVSIAPIGIGEIVTIQTSTKTMIIDGYPHHNCHYFVSGVLGRPITTANALLTKCHQSCIAGHQQGKQIAYARKADGSSITGMIVGSAYLHEENYLGYQGNRHWRGIVVLNEVHDGQFDELFVSMNYLQNKYGEL